MTPQEKEHDFAVADRIIRAVEDEWGIRNGEIRTRGRFRSGRHYDVEKRTAAYLIRMHTRLGWVLIGRAMGERTSKTVDWMTECAVRHLRDESEYAARVRKLEVELGFVDTVTELRRAG